MEDKLSVRLYNVGFGDCIMISVPDRSPTGKTTLRHILVDFGNVHGPHDPQDQSDELFFKPVVDDILTQLSNKPVDLYIMTHEHMDHVQGMLYASQRLKKIIPVEFAWLTASADEHYYESHPNAHKQKLMLSDIYDEVERFLTASRNLSPADEKALAPLWTLMAINNPTRTADCVGYLRSVAKSPPSYISRGVIGQHPFEEVAFEIWAPEEDTSSYYRKKQPLALGMSPSRETVAPTELVTPKPLAGVDAGAFYDLLDFRRRGCGDAMLSIDAAANNTSVVFMLEWRGWRLLFPGDAEQLSWKKMGIVDKLLKPVHFLKVSHHLSQTGTPPDDLLNKILPSPRQDTKLRTGAASTREPVYPGVPDDASRIRLLQRLDTLKEIGQNNNSPLFEELEFPDMK